MSAVPFATPPAPGLGSRRAGVIGGIVILVILALQRMELAQLAQWREDQATNLWLGFQLWRGQYLPQVGLITSIGIPNPNGMPWLGFFLSALPSLYAISLVLGLAQLGLLARLCWLMFRDTPVIFCATLAAAGSCLQVALTGVEFWNQWTLGLVNLLFFVGLIALRNKAPPFRPLFLIANCILAAPALYLPGMLNSAGFGALTLLAVWKYRVEWRAAFMGVRRKCLWIGLLLLHGALVWWPYPFAQATGFSELSGLSRPVAQRLREGALTLAEAPAVIHRLLPDGMDGLNQGSPDVMPASFHVVLRGAHHLLVILILVSLLVLLLRRQGSPALWFLVFILPVCAVSPLIGGSAWGLGERPDQAMQFLPLLLVLAFGTLGKMRPLQWPLLAAALLLGTVHLGLGHQLHTGLLNYHGPILGEADLPLADRRQAIDFIGADWKARSPQATPLPVPIFYTFGDRELYREEELKNWVWTTTHFGAILSQWYADSPYTIGRGYDWELLRRWHLTNQDEGRPQEERVWHGHRYTLSMVGLPPPPFLPASAVHHEFGRVRVSVLDSP